MVVYKITNKITGKCYIGITEKSLEDRWYGHLTKLKNGDQRHLYSSMRKYGIEAFTIEILDETGNYEELLKKERYYVSLYDSFNNGYNMTNGGDDNPMNIKSVKDSHDAKMRSKEVRNKISMAMKGYREKKPFSKEHRDKISEAMIGNRNFGSGDTRSIGCYCILNTGERFDFHSIKDATKWWFDTYKPLGDRYAECTLQRKIKKSINGEPITYIASHNRTKKHPEGKKVIVVDNIKWFKS